MMGSKEVFIFIADTTQILSVSSFVEHFKSEGYDVHAISIAKQNIPSMIACGASGFAPPKQEDFAAAMNWKFVEKCQSAGIDLTAIHIYHNREGANCFCEQTAKKAIEAYLNRFDVAAIATLGISQNCIKPCSVDDIAMSIQLCSLKGELGRKNIRGYWIDPNGEWAFLPEENSKEFEIASLLYKEGERQIQAVEELKELNKNLAAELKEQGRINKDISEMKNSISMKIGLKITAPLRKIKR